MSDQPQAPQRIVVTATKSPGVAVLLAFLFGPLGMLYATILGAIVMGIISIFVGAITLGIGLFVTWPICMIWAYVSTNRYNAGLMRV